MKSLSAVSCWQLSLSKAFWVHPTSISSWVVSHAFVSKWLADGIIQSLDNVH